MSSPKTIRHLKQFSSNDVGFFEGTEKLLEIWFDFGSAISEKCLGLRVIPRKDWEELVDVAQCKIISSCSNGYFDAFLLSESALLISSNRFILKTCGNTTLLSVIQPLMSLVTTHFPGSEVMNLYYSHLKFQEPLLQPLPYSNFNLEVSYLNKIFQDGTGTSFGKEEDVWFLYSVERSKLEDHDQTIEILMNDLNPEFMALFSTLAYTSSEDLIKDTGLGDLFSGAIVDGKVFEPCGFSLNAIHEDVYYTVHVTPQIECSWVSFETNMELKSSFSFIEKVLRLFRPGKAAVSLMANEDATYLDVNLILGENTEYSCINCEKASLSAYFIIFIELQRYKDMI